MPRRTGAKRPICVRSESDRSEPSKSRLSPYYYWEVYFGTLLIYSTGPSTGLLYYYYSSSSSSSVCRPGTGGVGRRDGRCSGGLCRRKGVRKSTPPRPLRSDTEVWHPPSLLQERVVENKKVLEVQVRNPQSSRSDSGHHDTLLNQVHCDSDPVSRQLPRTKGTGKSNGNPLVGWE